MGRSSVWLALLFAVSSSLAQNEPIVKTLQGNVLGLNVNNDYYAFYAIPYAGSTSGSKRFKAPTEAPKFPGIFHATDPSSYNVCLQPSRNELTGVEDCLMLNIFTRNLTTAASQPVFILIDGNEYTTTRNNFKYSFSKLVAEDVVVVTLNYRLSVFGFLCLGVEDAPGNAGLKDVIAGLKWVNQNIVGFGGNPDNVVLFGHGSGAAMADLVTLSHASQNLVHKVIASSGTSLAPWAVSYNPIRSAEAFGEVIGITTRNRTELAQELAKVDSNVLVNALANFKFLNNTVLFAPCVEDLNLNPSEAVITDAPLNILRSGNYTHVNFITGYSDADGTFRAAEAVIGDWLAEMNLNFADALQGDLFFESLEQKTAVAQDVKEFYFGTNIINFSQIQQYLKYQTETLFLISTIRAAHERSQTSREEVRCYEFGFRGIRNPDWPFSDKLNVTGAIYGSFLNYIFDYDLTQSDKDIQKMFIDRWTTFAKTGVPQKDEQFYWGDINNNDFGKMGCYQIKGEEEAPGLSTYTQTFLTEPHAVERNFWNNVYSKYYALPKPPSSASSVIINLVSVIIPCLIFLRCLQ